MSDTTDRRQALAAYNGMIAAWTGMLDSGYLDPTIARYSNLAVASKLEREMAQMNAGGLIYHGSPKSSPTIKSIDLSANPPTATINDCFDSRNWTTFFNKGPNVGKSAVEPGQKIVPHPLAATLNKSGTAVSQLQAAGGWLVVDFTLNTDQTC